MKERATLRRKTLGVSTLFDRLHLYDAVLADGHVENMAAKGGLVKRL